MNATGKVWMLALIFISIGSIGFADGTDEKNDAYIGLPAYLYGTNSVFGLQGGFHFGNSEVRLDLNVAEEYRNGVDTWSALPSVGYFISKDFESTVRFYEGLAVGVEKGLVNSFDGITGFVNFIAGVELLYFGDKTFFIEVGSGASFPLKEGAFNGGTILGGGFRYHI